MVKEEERLLRQSYIFDPGETPAIYLGSSSIFISHQKMATFMATNDVIILCLYHACQEKAFYEIVCLAPICDQEEKADNSLLLSPLLVRSYLQVK